MQNLTPLQQRRISEAPRLERLAAVSPSVSREIDSLKNTMQHGLPLDDKHPGMQNLTASQQAMHRELEAK